MLIVLITLIKSFNYIALKKIKLKETHEVRKVQGSLGRPRDSWRQSQNLFLIIRTEQDVFF